MSLIQKEIARLSKGRNVSPAQKLRWKKIMQRWIIAEQQCKLRGLNNKLLHLKRYPEGNKNGIISLKREIKELSARMCACRKNPNNCNIDVDSLSCRNSCNSNSTAIFLASQSRSSDRGLNSTVSNPYTFPCSYN